MKKSIVATAAAVFFALAALPLFGEPSLGASSLEEVVERLAREKVVHGMFRMEKSSVFNFIKSWIIINTIFVLLYFFY